MSLITVLPSQARNLCCKLYSTTLVLAPVRYDASTMCFTLLNAWRGAIVTVSEGYSRSTVTHAVDKSRASKHCFESTPSSLSNSQARCGQSSRKGK